MPYNIDRCVQLLHRHLLVQTSGQQWCTFTGLHGMTSQEMGCVTVSKDSVSVQSHFMWF